MSANASMIDWEVAVSIGSRIAGEGPAPSSTAGTGRVPSIRVRSDFNDFQNLDRISLSLAMILLLGSIANGPARALFRL